MNLAHLRYFVELVNTRHYTKAAKRLCITQPSLSYAISQLENELGVPLFEKDGRNLSVTEFGQQFFDYAQKALVILDEGIQEIQKNKVEERLIKLGFILPLGVKFIPEIVSTYLEENPGLNVRFSFENGITEKLINGLISKTYDVVFCSKPPENLGLTAVPVINENLVLIVSPKHPLANRYTVSLKDTLEYSYVYFSKGSGLRDLTDNIFSSLGYKPNIAYEVEEDRIVAGLVAKNFGIAIVSYSELLIRLNVKIIPIVDIESERKIYMVNNSKTFINPSVQSFYNFVINRSGEIWHGLIQ